MNRKIILVGLTSFCMSSVYADTRFVGDDIEHVLAVRASCIAESLASLESVLEEKSALIVSSMLSKGKAAVQEINERNCKTEIEMGISVPHNVSHCDLEIVLNKDDLRFTAKNCLRIHDSYEYPAGHDRNF